MDEGVKVPVLQLKRKFEIRELLTNSPELRNYPKPMRNITHMIVSHFKDD